MRTLIVDDSKFIREFLKQILEPLGIDCVEAEDGRAALNLLQDGDPFELMLVDMNMPVMHGLECVRLLKDKALAPAMKVMMVTTEADHSLIEQALAYGADEFLMKPFTAQSLREKMLLLGFQMEVTRGLH